MVADASLFTPPAMHAGEQGIKAANVPNSAGNATLNKAQVKAQEAILARA